MFATIDNDTAFIFTFGPIIVWLVFSVLGDL